MKGATAGELLNIGFWADSLLESLEDSARGHVLSEKQRKSFLRLSTTLRKASKIPDASALLEKLRNGRGLEVLCAAVPTLETESAAEAMSSMETQDWASLIKIAEALSKEGREITVEEETGIYDFLMSWARYLLKRSYEELSPEGGRGERHLHLCSL